MELKRINFGIDRYGVVDGDGHFIMACFDLDLIACNVQIEGARFFHDAGHDLFRRPAVNRRLERLLAKRILELEIAEVHGEQLHE